MCPSASTGYTHTMNMQFHLLGIALSALLPAGALAQAGDSRPSSVTTKLGENKVTITVSGGERLIVANGLPDHATGQFPGRGNPNRISAQGYNFHLPTEPKAAAKPTPANGAWFGVALNGVPFEPGTAEFWNGQREWMMEASPTSLTWASTRTTPMCSRPARIIITACRRV